MLRPELWLDMMGNGGAKGGLSVFGAAIKGSRSQQQDAFRIRWLEPERAWLLVLADGMGGHAAGDLASRLAVDGFVAAFVASRRSGMDLAGALHEALEAGNAHIANAQQSRPELVGMGTTLVAAHLSSNGIAWISVGDSPMWLYRRGRMVRLNEDHSLREAAREGFQGAGNMLRSALTGQRVPLIDCRAEPVPLLGGDLVMLCSDGVLSLAENEIADLLQEPSRQPAETMTKRLLWAVDDRHKPNQDNCTVVVAAALQVDVQADVSPPVRRISRGDIVVAAISAALGAIAVLLCYFVVVGR